MSNGSDCRGRLNQASVFEEAHPLVNLGVSRDTTIGELAELAAKIVGFTGKIVLIHPSRWPQRKLTNVGTLASLGSCYRTSLEDGINRTPEAWQSSLS